MTVSYDTDEYRRALVSLRDAQQRFDNKSIAKNDVKGFIASLNQGLGQAQATSLPLERRAELGKLIAACQRIIDKNYASEPSTSIVSASKDAQKVVAWEHTAEQNPSALGTTEVIGIDDQKVVLSDATHYANPRRQLETVEEAVCQFAAAERTNVDFRTSSWHMTVLPKVQNMAFQPNAQPNCIPQYSMLR